MVQELQTIKKTNHDEHEQPKTTKGNYGGYIKMASTERLSLDGWIEHQYP
jgi:hypothetical protein